MEFNEFKEELEKGLQKLEINLNNEQIRQFYQYMNMLLEKNKVMNLTGITEPKEFILKHFIDSLTTIKYIKNNEKIIDVGTGAGFPGIPLKITDSTLDMVLLDSLNKRLNFINEVIKENSLKEIYTIHGRAEDFGKDVKYREKFDVAISRAVAPLNVLLEYMMPFVKVGGRCICMKGNNCEEEVKRSEKAIKVLGGKIEKIEEFNLINTENKRTIIIIKKAEKTRGQYPRNAGIPTKMPL